MPVQVQNKIPFFKLLSDAGNLSMTGWMSDVEKVRERDQKRQQLVERRHISATIYSQSRFYLGYLRGWDMHRLLRADFHGNRESERCAGVWWEAAGFNIMKRKRAWQLAR